MKITKRRLRRFICETIEAPGVSRSRLFHPEKNPRLKIPREIVEREIAGVAESFRTGEYQWGPGTQVEFENMAAAGAGSDGWRFDAFPDWEDRDFQTVIDIMSTL